jgi:hypothetical protein
MPCEIFLAPKNEGLSLQVIRHVSGVKSVERFRFALLALLAVGIGGGAWTAAMVFGQSPAAHPANAGSPLAVSNSGVASSPGLPEIPAALSHRPTAAQPNEHPLMPVLRWAEKGLPAIEKLKDYSATLVRRERIRGKLSNYEYTAIKVRHQPFSVYVCFQGPASVKGQEVIYVEGQNQGNLLAHRARLPATVSLNPEGLMAMNDRHYPLTQIGLVNLVRRLVEVGQQDLHYGECEVKYFTGAKVNDRVCTVIQVLHPTPRDQFHFHLARVFVDDELLVPIRYESYDWPREPGGQPELIEEYSYLDLKLNNGFTDDDFSTRNPEYHFHQPAADADRGDATR